jgi:hypothetical protein
VRGDLPILEIVSVWMTVPNRMDWARKRSIISGPRIPSGNPGLSGRMHKLACSFAIPHVTR